MSSRANPTGQHGDPPLDARMADTLDISQQSRAKCAQTRTSVTPSSNVPGEPPSPGYNYESTRYNDISLAFMVISRPPVQRGCVSQSNAKPSMPSNDRFVLALPRASRVRFVLAAGPHPLATRSWTYSAPHPTFVCLPTFISANLAFLPTLHPQTSSAVAKGKRKKTNAYVYVDTGCEVIPDGPATILVDEHGKETVQYWSPGRRVEKRPTDATIPSTSRLPSLLDTLGDLVDEPPVVSSGVAQGETREHTTKSNTTPHSIMLTFLEKWAQKFLNVFRSRETDAHLGKPCYKCMSPAAPFRCTDCFNGPMLCQSCMVQQHAFSPLHRVQHWNGTYLKRKQLSDLGLVFSVDHHGRSCPSSSSARTSNLTVVHTTGIQTVTVQYCECRRTAERPPERPVQLCQAGLWPASFSRPQTALTIHVLGFFTQLTYQAKTSAHDFYGTLRRLTSNAFFEDVKDRYREFMTAHRQFNYLQTLKRFATDAKRKLDPGSLALRCPACPHPHINMDPTWKERPKEEWYKDALHFAKDGNFSLSQHDKKMDAHDFPLMDGAAYYVDSNKYREYKMDVYEDVQDETTTCSNFSALAGRYKGKIKSGQVGLSCTRHGFVIPCGTVDLHIGERYANVDYATLSGIQWFLPLRLFISSYDVNCKYGIHWWERLRKIAAVLPTLPGVSLLREAWPIILRCVPKWHLSAHTGLCRYFCSFYYMPGVGNTDGKSLERRWAALNAIGRSVREMGPGHRQDVIDAHNSDFNVQKTFKIGRHLQAKLKDAESCYADKSTELDSLEATLLLSNRPLAQWKQAEAAYIAQMNRGNVEGHTENPYQPAADEAPTTHDVLAQLKQDDPAKRKGNTGQGTKRKASALEDVSGATPDRRGLGDLLMAAFDLERQQ
ncbi:hypothetical protein EVJ58_g9813 [Rhodofomes roseus]|uniref:CxC2-like cysteine cluster KDZ transposase-associated domain-containing protein n=1 Tax=Rhodofomes roseus TaxID=34475 RepID=A0A4Y9XR39_9APHY|nr:hypothetical protein EVJ58_g9813 [Rhodofomes roseus]